MNIDNLKYLYEVFIPNYAYNLIEYDNLKLIIGFCSNAIIQTYTINNFNKIEITLLLNKNNNSNFIEIQHIYRLLTQLKNNHDSKTSNTDDEYWNNHMDKILKILSDYNTNYCTICGTELKIKGINKISHCDNDEMECVKHFYHTITDNRVRDLYNNEPTIFMFLLNVFISGLSHPYASEILKPFPNILSVQTPTNLKNILNEKIGLENLHKLMDIISSSTSELELELNLAEKFNDNENLIYAILKNSVSNNYFSMNSTDDIFPNSNIKLIHINYSADIENKFQQKYFLFHGSKIYSWYPIIKNGLRVMSKTNFQANGAAHGNGIYFSDNFNFSLNYSNERKMNLANSDVIVGVFEILNDPSIYKKSSNIFVIDDPSIILLRSLVITKFNSQIPKDITKYFTVELPIRIKTNKIGIIKVKNKRLYSEHKKLLLEPHISNISILSEHEWIIYFTKIKNYDIFIKVEFSNYPILPPIIKIKNSNTIAGEITNTDNEILNNKIFNIDEINPANWKLTSNLIDITKKIFNCLSESL